VAYADVTATYVDIVSYGKYASRTAVSATFEAVKSMQSQYLNPSTDAVPDKKYTHGLALLICHYYALDDTQDPDSGGPDTSVGAITTERVGRLTQTRGMQPYLGAIPGSKTWLMQTKYGTEFYYLMKTFKPTPIVL